MIELKRLERAYRYFVPPAVRPLIEAYTSHKRSWNGNHRLAALAQLEQAVAQASSAEEFSDWLLGQRYSGPLVELRFAFHCFRREAEPLPEEDLGIARRVIAAHRRDFSPE